MTTTQTTAPAPTPGYSRRIAIFFDTTARGQRIAYRWSPLQFRAFRIPLADAEIMRATETADVICCHPMRPCTHKNA